MSKIDFSIEGMDEIVRMCKELGDFSDRNVTAAAKAGAKIAEKKAKDLAPKDKGILVEGIISKGEKKRGAKKVYDIMMDPKKRDVFARQTSDGKVRTSSGKTKKGDYYYPASMEYGFISLSGRLIPGHHFLRDALMDNEAIIEKAMIEGLIKKIDKEFKKKGR